MTTKNRGAGGKGPVSIVSSTGAGKKLGQKLGNTEGRRKEAGKICRSPKVLFLRVLTRQGSKYQQQRRGGVVWGGGGKKEIE